MNINRVILALMQFLAYSILLLRPAFAAITDKYKIIGHQRKYYIFLSGYVLTLIYIFLGITLNNILIFGIFLVLIFMSSTMLDVSTKSLIIDTSPSDETKKRAFFFITVGSSLGGALPFFLYFLLINDIYSMNSWTTLFFCNYIFLIPLLFFLPFINEKCKNQDITSDNSANYNLSKSNTENKKSYYKFSFILLSVFTFLAFSDIIYSYPFFPFILNKFGNGNFNLFNFYLIFFFILSITSTAVGTFFIKRVNPRKMIFILIPILGIMYILYTVVDFTFFVILYFTAGSLATITNLNISVYIMRFTKENKSLYFHIVATFKNLSLCFFIPLGIFLSNFIITEQLIIIGALLLNFSLIPLIFIKI
ncbi:MAG: MFS transporter [Promethearchaeota archaeon]